jgi:hypothetical protein
MARLARIGKRTHSTTPETRLEFVNKSLNLLNKSVVKSRSERARRLQIPVENLRRWEMAKVELAEPPGKGRRKLRSKPKRKADDIESEQVVYGLFVYRRRHLQRQVGMDWLCKQMRHVVAARAGVGTAIVKKYSRGWCKRYGTSLRSVAQTLT